MNKYLRLDFETRSDLDLEEVGSHNYSIHPSTRALLVAIETHNSQLRCYDLTIGGMPKEWQEAIDGNWLIKGWGIQFEYEIIKNTLKWPMPVQDLWRDTQAKALACGFPAKLELCAKAMRLVEQKDKSGHDLIRYFQKHAPHDNPEKWQQFKDYCLQDVRTERAIDETLPDLTDGELAYWLSVWEQNLNGIGTDTALCDALIAMSADGKSVLAEKIKELEGFTGSLNSHNDIVEYAASNGVAIDSIAKPRLKEALAGELPDNVRELLDTRLSFAKTSVKKLDSIKAKVDNNRLYHMSRANGTGTGRESSVGLNYQNFPRGQKMDVNELVSAALARDTERFLQAAQVNGRLDPLGGVVTCLRGVMCAGPGMVLHQCDYSAVEPRIGAWLLDDKKMLDAFRRIDSQGGVDIYQIEAAYFYGCQPEEIKGERRQFGKVYVLQNQYESGEHSIQRAAKDQYGVILTLEQARECKLKWRAAHPKWVAAWYDLERGAIAATTNPKQVYQVGRVAFCHDGSHLKLRLPCGRIVWFPWATVEEAATPWGTVKPCISYEYRENKQWVRGTTHGGAIFNVCVQGLGASLIRYASRNLRRRGFKTVLKCHDEIVIEGLDSPEVFANFKATMLEVPPWAKGLPLAGAGWSGQRYRKD
jgi:DNA polymerase